MAKNRNALTAGIFMLACIALAIAVIIGIGGTSMFGSHNVYLVKFNLKDNVSGLRTADDVRLGGHRVGKVEWIEFVHKGDKNKKKPELANPAEEDEIIVAISTPDDDKLTDTSIVSIEAGLTGAVNVNISDLGTGALVGEGFPLVGHPGVITTLMNRLNDLSDTAEADLQKFSTLETTYNDLGADARAKVDVIVGKGDTVLDDAHDWLGAGGGGPANFHGSIADIHAITSHLREKTPELTATAQQFLVNLNTGVDKIKGVIDDFHPAIPDAVATVANLRQVVERNQGKIDEIISEVKSAMVNAHTFTEEIASNPSSVLLGPDDHQKLYNAARAFAEGAGRLNDASADLRAALNEKQPDPARVQALYDKLAAEFANFREAEDALWKQVK